MMAEFLDDNCRDAFILPDETYLQSHSVGRPLKTAQQAFEQAFWAPWQTSGKEPWGEWLTVIEAFRQALGKLYGTDADNFCPQVNLSSALTKVLMSHPRLSRGAVVLMSEQDFPSMGFAMQQALGDVDIRFIAAGLDITDPQVWAERLTPEVDLVFVSHVYSNTGECAPVLDVAQVAKERGIIMLVDVAQSAGILPLELDKLGADFVLGSCVKWLCGGPGAAWLWVNPARLDECQPKDVGWFSHENPFEFDIHQFRYHPGALRFWGGTPSVAPYAMAAHSISYLTQLGVDNIRHHNQQLLDLLHQGLPGMLVSPVAPDKRSGTAIINGRDNQALLLTLNSAGFSVDCRRYGLRISPHIYNTQADILRLIAVIQEAE
ncbi:aminotransferase class V-fold PLP-dependent enzyme [Shewanella sp. GXUN23E]|uniref:aminotransferase class V-fold PLP-dependent enzyme n=1 Tax=Shewanella sp. GXUN23E TaxID=3422498 RepID=UPI003D7DA371